MLELQTHPDRGRFYVAKQRINAGTEVFHSQACAKIADQGSKGKICSACLSAPEHPISPPSLRPALEISCPHCMIAYCSSRCQDIDREVHRITCDFWKGHDKLLQDYNLLDTYTRDYIELLIRIIVRSSREENDFSLVWNMCDNQNVWPLDRFKSFESAVRVLDTFVSHLGNFKFPQTQSFDMIKSNIIRITGLAEPSVQFCACYLLVLKEECNSFGLYTYAYTGPQNERQGYGIALYPTAVFFNHSCLPTIKHVTEKDASMKFYALVTLEKGDEATICYVSPQLDVESRAKILMDWFLFRCECVRCVGDRHKLE